MKTTTLQISETISLKDTYTGESLMRHAEIGETTFSELEKMIEEKTGFRLKKTDKPILKYELPGEPNPAELTLIEGCYTSPYVEIMAQIKNPADVERTYKNMNVLLETTVNSLKNLGKVSE